MNASRRATPSARCSAQASELGAPAYRGLSYALPLSLALWALLLWGCAASEVEQALRAYDRAAAMKLVAERLEKPHARLRDGAPWTRERGVEISR